MKKYLKWTAIIVGSLVVLGFLGMQFMFWQTKKASPEEAANYINGSTKIEVVYCRPYKKGREIFGGLVPYGEVWRTGANEATTFTTTVDIIFGDTPVSPGTYTLWTIPNANSWEVILNDHDYFWGVSDPQTAARDPQYDIANVNVPTRTASRDAEQFTITFDQQMNMHLMWDKTEVIVPISLK